MTLEETLDEHDTILAALEHAPKEPGTLAKKLRGWWTPTGWYVCAKCAGRIMARGCHLPNGSTAVWKDRAEPYGVCLGCNHEPKGSHENPLLL
jgi:hypothetical protein